MSLRHLIDLTFEREDNTSPIEDEVDVLNYDADSQDEEGDWPDYIIIDNGEAESSSEDRETTSLEFPEEFEIPSLRLECGVVAAGDTVELEDTLEAASESLHSGDFLRVVSIMENSQTEEVKLRGYRLRREKYLRPQFDGKVNEVFMVIMAKTDDPRPPLVQALEDIAISKVVSKRECIFTNGSYPFLSDCHIPPRVPACVQSPSQCYKYVFTKGRLICRWMNVVHSDANGKTYSGVIRDIPCALRDKLPPSIAQVLQEDTHLKSETADTDISERWRSEQVKGASLGKRPRSDSVEETVWSNNRHLEVPIKAKTYTAGDCCCGAGGASKGAQDAGLTILWGIDLDEMALRAYSKNFPGAIPFPMDIHDVPRKLNRKDYGVDILHLSCPCCFWSANHTIDGKNDQANMETLYTVGPILAALKPRIATLEQAPGLIMLQKHKLHFRNLLNQIITAGYNVRYKVQDLAEFGLPQRRRRLLIIAARRGTPLPPFPKPTHGTTGSGLKRFVSVYDALEPLRRVSPLAAHDTYHQPEDEKPCKQKSFEPRSSMVKGCITTNGGANNFHYSGTRKNTVREYSLFQGFKLGFHFAGPKTQAMKQVGNVYPPIVAKAVFLLCAQVLEAFDHGMIDAEEEIDDLHDTLTGKGIKIQKRAPHIISLLDGPSEPRNQESPFSYLDCLEPSKTSRKKHSLWGRIADIQLETPEKERTKKFKSFDFGYISEDDDDDFVIVPPRSKRSEKSRQEQLFWAEVNGEVIQVD